MPRLHTLARHHGLYAATLLSVAAVMLYLGRVWHTGELTFLFLPYNLVLGAIPLAVAVAAYPLARGRGWWIALPLLAVWLVFLPNSSYLLTDLVHLRSREGMPHVYDSTMMGLFAAAGFVLGLASMSLVEERLRADVGWPLTALSLPVVLLLNGLGVYIGRYLRWNSWDLATRPLDIVEQVGGLALAPSSHLWGITGTYTVVLGVAWLAFVSVRTPATPAVRA